jgi:hypothetical protein
MSANGISHLATKELRQRAKLELAQAKRQGKTVAVDGTITGQIDPTKPYYRTYNTFFIDELPTQYVDDSISDNANVGGLLPHRPWIPTVVATGEAIDTESTIDITTEAGDTLIAE